MDRNDSLLFIPDISGFTDFVENTELNHSQHIISELLEAIIDANELGLSVSEIEGDAILFYKQGNVPTINEVIVQAEKMFLSFQKELNNYVHRRICQCGACSTASNLSLKFIVHSGDIAFITVKDHTKLHGPAVILAHKLLKNDLEFNEYILFTDKLIDDSNPINTKGSERKIQRSKALYKDLGEIEFNYISLEEKKKGLPVLPPLSVGTQSVKPIRRIVKINKPINHVYEAISNFKYRLEWADGLDDFKYDPNELNRIGSKHICVIQNKDIGFETVTNSFGEGKIVYGEKPDKAPIVKEMTIYYILEKDGDGTKLTHELHFIPKSGLGRLLVPIFKMAISKNTDKGLSKFKEFCESTSLEVETVEGAKEPKLI